MTATTSKAGLRAMERVSRVSEAIEDHTTMIAETVSALVSELAELGVLRVHREWSASAEHSSVAKAAAEAAVQAVLRCGWCDLPAEVEAIHVVSQ